MRTVVLAMPDEPDAVPGWLERELVGANLPQLVAELGAVHDATGRAADIQAVLGREALLNRGLEAVPRRVLQALLRTPSLLPELQSLVFESGGPHWDDVIAETDLPRRADAVSAEVRKELAVAEPRRASGTGRWATMAAAVLVAVTGSAPAGWGFTKIAELPRTGGAKAVYAKLADLADEWNKKPTASPLPNG